ncbi:hypothetical protein HN018_06855 [Lichenicola cladoniae]|uniref:Uncharacterized protein n=1 Tax=Lichenicola cladoniae TaxID=1484109 RepID=A0A6M8HNC3_9PROT|nr:hypothetical protein [Lichenicola cladoniae]NPD67292.1 hypothetical protein [Acetobacteraceae bacterium]QKE89795.1 hypothetical protein HN018_06855 [Lichenicola cladoniae]
MSESTLPERIVEKTVRFRRSYQSWNRGVEAGFPVLTANSLIARGIAVDISTTVEREPLAGRIIKKA